MSNQHHKDAVAAYREQLRAAGKWPPKGRRNTLYNEVSQARLENGLCPRCGGVPEEGYKVCQTCINRVDLRAQERYRASRQAIFDHYGHSCACCGEDEQVFLAITPPAGPTKQKGDQRNLTAWLIKNNFPDGFRVLCHNCAVAMRRGRTCPHQLPATEVQLQQQLHDAA